MSIHCVSNAAAALPLGQPSELTKNTKQLGCSDCAGLPGKAPAPAPLVVAGVLAAYAAQLRGPSDDFAPVWPQAFPEHLRNGSGGRVSVAKVG